MTTTTLTLAGSLVATDDDAGTLRYRLLTYGEEGRTNRGKVTITAGSLTVPADPSTLEAVNVEHDPLRPVGRVEALEDDGSAIYATVRTLDTTAGRDVRLEAREGVRAGISVEIDRVVIRAGKLLAGVLTGMGLVVRPAFPSSLLTASDAGELTAELREDLEGNTEPAQNMGDDDEDEDAEEVTVTDAETGEEVTTTSAVVITPAETTTDPDPDPTDPDPAPSEEDTMTDTTVRAAGIAGAGRLTTEQRSAFGLEQLTATLGDKELLRGEGKLTAALAPITQTSVYDKLAVPEYVGELWEGRSPVERYAGLAKPNGPLTAAVSKGWEFTQGPEVHPYAGNLADITSTPITVDTKDIKAERLAGGNRLDRIHTDLPDAGFWDSYLRHSTQDYAIKRDARIGHHIMTNATAATYDDASTPSFYNGSKGWAYLVRAARIAMRKVVPDFAIVGADLWEEMALTPREYALEYLSAQLGLDDTGSLNGFRIIGASDEPLAGPAGTTFDMTGKVLAGTTGTTLLQELPGGPIRVNAEVIDKGGIDHGVFGYIKLWTPTKYNVLVSPAAPAGA
ncbi:hypothetical protein [Brachybacterium paraconglomeratum]|uniref:hypothetical protein n=1 Tax=Brachybacterium paraconglomeratum TaxID=173362 RepID=UPI0022AEC836|nr:hypothetical protein [Brachybacterium paraconglomeratum]MCZ4324762.1 hypothetical protein [Brachybacterium paraconglomeratum]